jgi:hypothetical protein
MNKRLISFAFNPHFLEGKKLDFVDKKEGKIEITACIFSTAHNRNKGYFQVSKLLSYSDKLERIMHNFNHDLTLSNGKYFGNKTKMTKMWSEFNNGELEIWAILESSDPDFIARKDEITAPSIELLVSPDELISNENGEYFIDFDFIGVGWLLGIPAGSGDTRITAIREFSHDLVEEKIYNINNNNMTEEQLQAQLESQKNELTEVFKSEIETIKADFADNQEAQLKQFNEIVAESASIKDSIYEYTDEKGNQYRCTSQDIYQSITELLNDNKDIDTSTLGLAMKAKGYSITKIDSDIEEVEESAKKAIEIQSRMKSVRTDENLEGRPAENSADTKVSFKKVSFKENLKNQILKNLNLK